MNSEYRNLDEKSTLILNESYGGRVSVVNVRDSTWPLANELIRTTLNKMRVLLTRMEPIVFQLKRSDKERPI